MSQALAVDRRASPRRQVEIQALVLVPKQFHTHATVVDLSEGGCQLRLQRPLELPQRFIVQFNGAAYLCDRRWMVGANMGLQFIDMLTRAQRRKLASLPATPRI
ncbi:MAG: PilZ domain-containing protein [Hyphomicrobiales bacterium]|nr:PilZ domain-containing protein [Hyphomicrobiales bacterium]